MKKFLVVLVIVAMTCLSSMAFAADVSTSGSIEYLMRSFINTDLTDNTSDNRNFTLERVRLNIDAKAGDALSGRIGIENDWDTWGRFEKAQGNAQLVTNGTSSVAAPKTASAGPNLNLREAWISFKMPGTPVGVKGGHMLLQLGNAWFFRAMKYGSDAWVAYTDIDALHLGLVNIKVAENSIWAADDTDAYSLVATYKLSDTMSAGVNYTIVNDRTGQFMTTAYKDVAATTTAIAVPNKSVFKNTTFVNADIQNLGVHFTGKVGPAKLNAEIDLQSGDATELTGLKKHTFSGNQVVIQATVPMDALTINATIARGSGAKTGSTNPANNDSDVKEYIALMDADVHYTLVYEYLTRTAARQSFKSIGTGFGNTTAISLGGAFNVSKNLMVGADAWLLQATEKVSPGYAGATDAALTNDLGTEIDVKVNWKLYENLTWNTTAGWFMPGDAYKTAVNDSPVNAHAIQSVLSFKF